MIVNLWGQDRASAVIGSSKVLRDAWARIDKIEEVITISVDAKAKTLLESGHEIFVPCPRFSNRRFLEVVTKRTLGDLATSFLLNFDSLVFSIYCLVRIRWLLLSARVLHTYSFWFSLFCALSPKLADKLYYTELGGEWFEIAQGNASLIVRLRYLYLGRFVFRRVRVIAQSEISKKSIVACHVDPSRVSVVRHSRCDPLVFKPTTEKKVNPLRVIYVGRAVPQKGLHLLVKAADVLVNQRNIANVEFVVVGPGAGFGSNIKSNYASRIEADIRQFKLEGYFTLKSFVSLDELVDLYSSSGLSVVPSLYDASPSTVIEAMLCEVAVVGTVSGGMAEQIVNMETGMLVPPGDVDALADSISYFIQNPGICYTMGSAGRRRAIDLYSTDGFWAELLEALR